MLGGRCDTRRAASMMRTDDRLVLLLRQPLGPEQANGALLHGAGQKGEPVCEFCPALWISITGRRFASRACSTPRRADLRNECRVYILCRVRDLRGGAPQYRTGRLERQVQPSVHCLLHPQYHTAVFRRLLHRYELPTTHAHARAPILSTAPHPWGLR
jgi:hypothetical protein